MTPDLGLWACHFCNVVRPDAAIAVVSRTRKVNGIEMQENRRYCSDREACSAAAAQWRDGLEGDDIASAPADSSRSRNSTLAS